MEKTKKQPFGKINVSNNIEWVFWTEPKKFGNKESIQLSVQLVKSWLDKETGEWESRSVGMNLNDAYRVVACISKIKEIEDRFKSELKIVDEN